jgi:splicing factor 3A subunit 2
VAIGIRYSHVLCPSHRQVAAEPYETIAFAIPAKEIVDPDEDPEGTWENWDPDAKVYSCQFLFR